MRISSYSFRMWENTGHKNSEYGHFSLGQPEKNYTVWQVTEKKHLEWHIESRTFVSLSLFTSIKSKAAVKYGSFMFTSALILVIVAQAWYSIDLILSYIFQGGITVKYTSRWSNYAKLAQAVWNCEPFFPSIDPTQ